MNFEAELKKGIFVVPKCTLCNTTVWPPSGFCSRCLGDTVWERAPVVGTVIEFSKQGGEYFCVAEMSDSLKIMGKVGRGIPEIGQAVRLARCGMRGGICFFDMELC